MRYEEGTILRAKLGSNVRWYKLVGVEKDSDNAQSRYLADTFSEKKMSFIARQHPYDMGDFEAWAERGSVDVVPEQDGRVPRPLKTGTPVDERILTEVDEL